MGRPDAIVDSVCRHTETFLSRRRGDSRVNKRLEAGFAPEQQAGRSGRLEFKVHSELRRTCLQQVCGRTRVLLLSRHSCTPGGVHEVHPDELDWRRNPQLVRGERSADSSQWSCRKQSSDDLCKVVLIACVDLSQGNSKLLRMGGTYYDASVLLRWSVSVVRAGRWRVRSLAWRRAMSSLPVR